jgi:hypothetical protein
LETPPNHAMFSMMHSVKVTKKNSTDDFVNHPSMTTYSQHFQHPQYSQQVYYPPPQSSFSYYYPDYDSRRSSTNSQISDQSLSFSLQTSDYKKSVPSIEDFLKELDKEFGEGKFTCYLTVFEEQEILVNQLTRLSDSEYNSMGVTIIGRRQILRDKAREYE